MKTPITDAAQKEADKAEAPTAIGIMRNTARKLELDRAALMEAIAPFARFACDETHENEPQCMNCIALRALAAARANFPEQSEPASH